MNEELRRLASALNSANSGTEPCYRMSPLKCSLVLEEYYSSYGDESSIRIPIPSDPKINAALQALLLQLVEREIRESEKRIVAAEEVVDRGMDDNAGFRQQIRRLEETDEDIL